uniref:IGF-like family receptor 1 n=1 Tax=Lepisosteus oculatus TaxID=7918 RepID=W5M8T0_LEPOC
MYSRKCRDALMFWHRDSGSCRLCADEYPIAAGFEFSPNCGLQDDGGRLDRPYQECGAGTFNDGSRARCQRCTLCPARQGLRGCSSTQDARCCGEGPPAACAPATPGQSLGVTSAHSLYSPACPRTESNANAQRRAGSFEGTPSSVLAASGSRTAGLYPAAGSQTEALMCVRVRVSLFGGEMEYCKILSCTGLRNLLLHLSFSMLCPVEVGDDLAGTALIAAPELQEAPLQAVLDNLDVLEELIMLLDPESTVAKSTRHVAARCSFPATWITYTYSMRDSKSPLQAVLEGVAAKWPDWTVGHLARLLSDIGRNDAVAALAKLPLPPSH